MVIELPTGYELEHPEKPPPMSATNLSAYAVDIRIDRSRNVLHYGRQFVFGEGGRIYFPVSAYKQLKGYFDSLFERDSQTLVLKQVEAKEPTKQEMER